MEELVNSYDKILFDTYGNDVLRYEELIELFGKRLRPTHYQMITVKKYLGDLYGLTPGFVYDELSSERLDLKIKYLREYNEVIGKVDGGCSKVRLYKTCVPSLIH